ncbi:thioredoxin domain-containing protein [Tessaracoccus sp. MC1865]|uniref:DsbA family protein n=1 Tax=Tessaracoccus sp. MC1865 TaxID=2760310 RepID=UPI001603AC08|nr:thioredoxin domain-containing protein [Tessaracoccus sp. MC1865]MBB1483615.1 thioredoxin domain-containing protein [Tessaracoccus sp. MC1865]QTO36694.1 thioredoxin domain-containing protein [Tessaracoccus sp. MC1865]
MNSPPQTGRMTMTKDKWIVLSLFLVLVVALIAFSQTRPLEQSAAPAAVPGAEAPAAGTPTTEAPVAELPATEAPAQEDPAAAPPPEEGTDAGADQAGYEQWVRDEFPRRLEGDPMAMGALDAPVVLTEWADYRCPFCSVFAEETLPLLQKYIDDGTLRIEFRDLALFGDESVKAATAARAAGLQGKYFEFQHAIFAATPNQGHPDIPDDLVMGIVADLGLDAAQFEADWAQPALRQAVLTDSQEAQGMGVSATPAFVVGTQFFTGAQPIAEFERVIEAEAAKLG